MEAVMTATSSNAILVLAVSIACVLLVWWSTRHRVRGDIERLRWHWRNLLRATFSASDAKRRRDMLHAYTTSVSVIDTFGTLLAAGVITQERRADVLRELGKARADLLGILVRGRDDERLWLAEHLFHGELVAFSGLDRLMIPRLTAFLASEIDVLSDAPHAVDAHTDRLAQFVLGHRD